MFHVFNISLRIKGFLIKKSICEFKKIEAISETDFENYVIIKRNEIVNYHLLNNPSYKDFSRNITFNTWNDLPVMTKNNFQKPIEERLSKGFNLTNVYVNKTSGASGEPFIFAKDKYAHALTWANIISRFGWYGIDFNSSLQARFYGIPLDLIGNTKERIKDFLSHRYRFPVFDLSDCFLEKVLVKFQRKNFDYINGYTSSIVLFAKYLQKRNVILSTICPNLKCCIVTSEMLFEEDKLLMEKQFGIPVVNEYGASELDLIAFQNPNGEWQVNSETLFVEILDDENNVVPNGKEGRIVITSLYNKAHPFIRYDIGDVGILDESSTIKKPILKKLIGRTNDIAMLPSGKKSPGLTFYYITKSIIEDDGNVKEFVIKQTKIDTFDIEYVSQNKLTESQILKIEQAIAIYLERGLIFSFIRKDKLERTKSGKLKQFVSLIN
jgi:phenylacetate-CoA ligase